MKADPAALALRDIHLPQPVAWWPLAPGWWVLAAGVLIAASALALVWWRRRRLRVQRAALDELAAIEQAYAATGDGHACARDLSQLLRRLSLAYAGTDMAASTGEDWWAQLSALGAHTLPHSLQTVLLAAPYSRTSAARISAAEYRTAGADLRTWLARLGPPRRRAAGAHAAV